jgi:hypothetical protein
MPSLSAVPRRWLAAILLLALAATQHAAHAQAAGAAPRDSAVKAAFLYKFGSFVEWPAATFRDAQDPLVIGVLGDDAVADELEQLAAGRSVEGRPVKVRSVKESELPAGVHVLFVGTLRPARLREVLASASGPVLVVTQQDGALAAGSVINFVADGSRVRFTASIASAEARGLRLSARLLAVAQSVDGKAR